MSKQNAVYPSLAGKSVFITGGAAGIGEVMVERFCQQQAKVTFIDTAVEKGLKLCEKLKKQYSCAPHFIECDIRNVEALQNSIADAGQRQGDIGVLINNAADDTRHSFEDMSSDYWDDRFAVNLKPCFFSTQAIVPQMIRLGGGSIINLGSVSWRKKQTCMPAYTTAKAAIEGLSRTLAAENGKHNIRVNTLIPGWVMTERQMTHWLDPEIVKEVQQEQCIHATLYPDDIVNAALFLASDDSKMMTAQSIVVDAGWT
ncbi:SDR family NAD(P)-dependent oxidoreductase [Aliiglaciecola lipolytica]|uniref:Short-chain dehydrogenase/reductase SDR n=1 Tax=Aliiglaciecola lipolytica E3 TaxID=1127673 RepID=K6YEA5_9ALTE|nr:SDR family oxidoreductase [Aliiglaciecola lipolytica]GAC16497.1 short-chain dehydrogenase/reductase SDR [Aliiglaciecola lipolytica E3]